MSRRAAIAGGLAAALVAAAVLAIVLSKTSTEDSERKLSLPSAHEPFGM